jgi:DHA1 family multidrug resistance protein-like MFS transporter
MTYQRMYSRVFFELVFIGFSIILGMGLIGAFLPLLAKDLDPTGSLVGLVVSAWFLARVFIEIPSGFLSDRIGRRRLFVLGIGLAVGGSLLCATAPTILFLIAGRAIWGFGIALFFLSNTAILFDLFDPAVRGRAVGTFQSIEMIGSFIGGPIGGVLAGVIGYNAVFYFTVALTGFSLVLAFALKDLRGIGGRPPQPLSQPSFRDALSSLKRWPILVICLTCLARMLIMNGVMSTVFQLYLYENLGFGVTLIGIVVGARTAGTAAATLASGYLSDRFGRKRIILLGLVLEAPCLYAYTLVNSFTAILLVGFLDAFGAGLAWTTLIVLLSEIVKPEYRGVAIGFYRTFMDVGGVLGPLLFMAIATTFGMSLPFLVGAILLLSMAGLTLTT